MKYRLSIYFLVLMSLNAFYACQKNDPKEVERITSKSKPAEVSNGVEALYSDSSRLKAKLIAQRMVRTVTEDPIIEMPKGLEVWFYGRNGRPESHLRANYGIRYVNKGLTRVDGNVQVVNLKGDSLSSEELFWDEQKQLIYSKKFVKVRTKDEIIWAEGFESDINFNNYSFYKIKGRISVKQ